MDTYEKKLALAKEALDSGSYDKETIEYIFPELRESEDEKIRKELIRYFTLSDEHAYNEACGVSYRDIVAWLEKQDKHDIGISETTKQKLEDNFNKPAWSEEDEEHIDSLLKRLDGLCRNKFERTRFAISEDRDWLKSIRPQNTWKPSEEHIHWLKWAINRMPDTEKANEAEAVLEDLLEQLKKLREE